ncbi:MAG: nicotinate-nucleotide adenylyltransferase [Dehalococcoidia bacterium]|nr:MAG: nicotinate-nucleotide adenylyltransferase [Dehalococcoidia bacterium]
MNIGVLGGTFDPVHTGHLVIAVATKIQLDLDEILFVPTGQPWLKANNYISPAEHRLHMVRLAIAAKPYFKLSTTEIERPGPSYTVDTITELKGKLGAQDELFFILGWDNLVQLPQWHQPSQLVKICRLVAIPRVGYPVPDLDFLEAAIPGLSENTILLNTPQIDISASQIRDRVRQGLSIKDLVPEAVEDYIKRHKLYLAHNRG